MHYIKIVKQAVIDNKWWIIVGSGMFFAALYFGMQSDNASDTSDDVTFTFATARTGDVEIVVSGTGQVQAAQRVDLKAVAAGDAIDVTEVHVTNNEVVTEGQILVSLDAREATRRVYDAQLALESAMILQSQADDDFDNLTQDDRRQRQLKDVTIRERQSSLAQAQESLADYKITAPFDGLITDLTVSSGDSISRSDIFASVITQDNEVSISLNEVDALSVDVGNKVTLTFDALQSLEIIGTVARVDTIGTATQGVVSYDVEISLDTTDAKLRPGMSANAEITAESVENVLIIPNSAIKGFGSDAYVEQMKGSEIIQTKVVVGTSNNFYSQITQGLSAGDEVITGKTAADVAAEESSSSSVFGNFNIPGTGGGGGGR